VAFPDGGASTDLPELTVAAARAAHQPAAYWWNLNIVFRLGVQARLDFPLHGVRRAVPQEGGRLALAVSFQLRDELGVAV